SKRRPDPTAQAGLRAERALTSYGASLFLDSTRSTRSGELSGGKGTEPGGPRSSLPRGPATVASGPLPSRQFPRPPDDIRGTPWFPPRPGKRGRVPAPRGNPAPQA